MMPRVFVVIRERDHHSTIHKSTTSQTTAPPPINPGIHFHVNCYAHFLLRFLPAVVCPESSDLRLLFNCSKFVNNRNSARISSAGYPQTNIHRGLVRL
jgi:hypothetical protein